MYLIKKIIAEKNAPNEKVCLKKVHKNSSQKCCISNFRILKYAIPLNYKYPFSFQMMTTYHSSFLLTTK